MEAILVFIGILIIIIGFIYHKICYFEERVLYFLLKENNQWAYKRVFIKELESPGNYIKQRGLETMMARAFIDSSIRSLLAEIEGFHRDGETFAKKQQYENACKENELRNAKIAKLYVALGSPRF